MNLFIWFGCRNESIKELQPETREPYVQCVWAVRKANLKVSRQRALLDPLKQECLDSQKDHAKAFERFWNGLKKENRNPLAEWADFPVFLFLYAGLYQGVFVCWIDPWLQKKPLSFEMTVTLGSLISCIGVYLILKLLLLLLCSTLKSWKRWGAFMGLFFLYLGLLFGCRMLDAGIRIPVWIVLVFSGILALWSVIQNRSYFEMEREKE